MESIKIIDDAKNTNSKSILNKGSIPQLLTDALSVSFDPNIGHDYIDNSENRFDFYNAKEVCGVGETQCLAFLLS